MNNDQLKIVLGDPRHPTIGRHSTYLPCGLGYIAAYTLAQFGEKQVSISLHGDIYELLEVIENSKPDVIGLANYCWNAELGKIVMSIAKQNNPNVICVAGGPEFPEDPDEVLSYMQYRNEIDFYIVQEGEVSFTVLIQNILQDHSLDQLKCMSHPGVYSLNSKKELIFETPPERLKDLDVIPSPFLSGILDKFLDGTFLPFLESQRGCPYRCTYCHEGAVWRNKVYGFSLDRVKADLKYIAKRMKDFPDIPLAMSDSNFGMFKQDEEIADYISQLEEKYKWPRSFIVDTGKSQLDRLINISLKLENRMALSVSPQSLNPKTLIAIKRTNLGKDDVESVYKKLNKLGITTNAGIILPLPEETKESFLNGIKKLCLSNIEYPLPYSAMLLKGTEMTAKSTRQKYGFKTKFRLIPRNFGEYYGQKVFEIEELCIETNTMNYQDYLDCRGFMLIFTVYSHHQMDVFKRHSVDLDFQFYDFILNIWESIKTGNSVLTQLYYNYIRETDGETFESPEELRTFYCEIDNYNALLKGEIGDNLIRKYMPKMLLYHTNELLEEGYRTVFEMCNIDSPEIIDFLNDALKWSKSVRYIYPLLSLQKSAFESKELELSYDVNKWYTSKLTNPSISSFHKPTRYRLESDYNRIQKSINTWVSLYGSDFQLWSSRLLEGGHTTFEELWYKCVLD